MLRADPKTHSGVLRSALRRWAALFRVGMLTWFAYRLELAIQYVTVSLPMVALVLWKRAAEEGPVGGLTEEQLTTYFLAVLWVTAVGANAVSSTIVMDIRQGTLARRLLQPVHPATAYLFETLSRVPIGIALGLPILLVELWWIGPRGLAPTVGYWLLLPIAIAGAWLVNFALQVIIGELAFFSQSALVLSNFYVGLLYLFGGGLMPIQLFPPLLRTIVSLSPFPYLLSVPAEIIVGMRPLDTMLSVVAIQWGYAAALLGVVALLWRMGLQRFDAYGG